MTASKLTELLVFGFMPLMLGVITLPGSASADEKTIAGEITYRERIALPPNAVVTVELADVSLADAPATIIGKQVIKDASQVPIKFTIAFDPAVIQPETDYAIQARITVDNQIWFVNDERYAFDPINPQPVAMVLKSAR